jgi:hypothetical protein
LGKRIGSVRFTAFGITSVIVGFAPVIGIVGLELFGSLQEYGHYPTVTASDMMVSALNLGSQLWLGLEPDKAQQITCPARLFYQNI